MVRFEILQDNVRIAECEYMYSDDNCFAEYWDEELKMNSYELYLKNVKTDKEVVLGIGEKFVFKGYYKGNLPEFAFIAYEATVCKELEISNREYLTMFINYDYDNPLEESLYFNQLLIDILYLWDTNTEFIELRKKLYIYSIACSYHSGITEVLPTDKVIDIDCASITTNYYFYTLLAEKLIGPKGYLGSNPGALSDCFSLSNLLRENKTENKNVINFYNLDSKIHNKIFEADYIIPLLEEFGFTVNIINRLS